MSQDRRRAMVDDPLMAVIEPALKVGAACGCAGFLVGGTAGILKSTTPTLFAIASGLQTFALGTTFWTCRGAILQMRDTGHLTPREYTAASTIAGGISGGIIALLTRGRRNVLPATLMWSLFGGAGQMTCNSFYLAQETSVQQPREGFWKRMARKRWSPVTVMSDEEYAEMLRERMLKVEVEIALLDDKIAALRLQQRAEGAQAKLQEVASESKIAP